MQKKLPQGWQKVNLNLISEVRSGIGFPDVYQGNKTKNIPFYKVGDISKTVVAGNRYMENSDNYINDTDLANLKGKLFPKGTIVFAKIGESLRLNRRAILSKPSLIDNNAIGVIPASDELSKYIYYFLRTIDLSEFSAGNSVPSVRKSSIENIQVALPPTNELKRISIKLDELFDLHDKISERVHKLPALIMQFKERVLDLAVTGELTKEWRKKRQDLSFFNSPSPDEMREVNIPLPDNWQWQPFSRVAAIKSNLVDPNKYLDYPLIAPDNIESGKGILISKPLVSDIMPVSGKHFFTKNCIVYSKIRPNLSKLVIVDFDGLCSADMYPIVPEVELRYMYYYMLSGLFLSYATTAGERSILPKINQKGLSIIPVSVPPRSEQQEIIRKVDALFEIANRIEQRYGDLKRKFENLPSSILDKAFSGELVEQDENDEPASELLGRLKIVSTSNEEKTLSQASTKVVTHESAHSLKSRIAKSRINNLLMNLTEIIKKHFENDLFTFEQLSEHLKPGSKEQYIKMKKEFFELLRNEKLKKKEAKIVSEVDKSLGVLKYKLVSNETTQA